jgi:hypothetical protein
MSARSHYYFSLPPEERLLIPISNWSAERVYDLCVGLRANIVTRGEVIERHRLSEATLDQWLAAFEHDGIYGLRVMMRGQARAA